MRIILASGSPRRRELLDQIGLSYEVIVSDIQETITAARPGEIVEELSGQKAFAVLDSLPNSLEEIVVIGADTVVAAADSILGKPVSKEHAVEMLKRLSGNTHQVYTGVTLYRRRPDGQLQRRTFHERTAVTFYPMSDEEIGQYAATGDCMDKAGAYGIQGFCARYIKGIEGSYSNVVGLPVGRLYQEIKEWFV